MPGADHDWLAARWVTSGQAPDRAARTARSDAQRRAQSGLTGACNEASAAQQHVTATVKRQAEEVTGTSDRSAPRRSRLQQDACRRHTTQRSLLARRRLEPAAPCGAALSDRLAIPTRIQRVAKPVVPFPCNREARQGRHKGLSQSANLERVNRRPSWCGSGRQRPAADEIAEARSVGRLHIGQCPVGRSTNSRSRRVATSAIMG